MKLNNLKIITNTKLALLLLLTVAITACAAIPKYGSSSTSWKEEVALHDGQTMIVKRTTKRSGGLERPEAREIIYKSLVFTPPNSRQAVTWEDKETEDIRSSNFHPLLLDIVENTPYLVTTALGCLSYNKWGRPNPPYIIFKYDGKAWQRIALQELPAQLTTPNLLFTSPDTVAAKSASNLISAATIKSLNSDSINKAYKTILREAIPKGTDASLVNCEELVRYKCGWGSPGEFNRKYFERTCK